MFQKTWKQKTPMAMKKMREQIKVFLKGEFR